MKRAEQFIFRPYRINKKESVVRSSFTALLADGPVSYEDSIAFPGVTEEMWDKVPPVLLDSLMQALSLMLGILYWKLNPTSQIVLEGFSLSKEQSEFWKTMYTKGLSEFYYRGNVDFRNLVAFPFDPKVKVAPVPFERSSRTLVTQGGGKDSIVVSEMLKHAGIPFTLFAQNPGPAHIRVARIMGGPTVHVIRTIDPQIAQMRQKGIYVPGYTSTSCLTFVALTAALLHDYRYIVFANEQSAEIGNMTHFGLTVNHQWGKTAEAEHMIRDYFKKFITPSVTHFSLLRQCSEIEVVRRFTLLPQYFSAFSSCNRPIPSEVKNTDVAYWCKECPKCVFVFACLSAFLPKKTVVGIVGEDLYAKPELFSMFRRLWGIEGFKPFECVGTAEEMIVATQKALATGEYDGEPVMELFKAHILSKSPDFVAMEKEVFSIHQAPAVPEQFEALLD